MDLTMVAALILTGAALAWVGAWLWPAPGAGIARFGARPRQRQLQSIERLPLTPNHSLHLVKFGDRRLLVAVHPHGCSVIDAEAPVQAKTEAAHAG